MSYYISYDINENIKQLQEHLNKNNLDSNGHFICSDISSR